LPEEDITTEVKEYVFKITILGQSAVGKTSLINQFVEGSFQEDYKPTLGANIIRKDVNIDKVNAFSLRIVASHITVGIAILK